MSKNDGGSAFPVSAIDAAEPGSLDEMKRLAQGMSLRDYFAAKAMQAWIETCKDFDGEDPSHADDLARVAYIQADSMLKEREK